jgi:hypothetical protein
MVRTSEVDMSIEHDLKLIAAFLKGLPFFWWIFLIEGVFLGGTVRVIMTLAFGGRFEVAKLCVSFVVAALAGSIFPGYIVAFGYGPTLYDRYFMQRMFALTAGLCGAILPLVALELVP